jgi:hypothetical protein
MLDSMTKPLPKVRPIAKDVRDVLEPSRPDLLELIRGLEPGWYTSRSLYPRYKVWAENRNYRPAGMHSLGARLRNLVGPENVKVMPDDQRAFHLTQELVSTPVPS